MEKVGLVCMMVAGPPSVGVWLPDLEAGPICIPADAPGARYSIRADIVLGLLNRVVCGCWILEDQWLFLVGYGPGLLGWAYGLRRLSVMHSSCDFGWFGRWLLSG